MMENNQLKSEIDNIYTLEFKQEMDMAIDSLRAGWIKQHVTRMRDLIIRQNQLIKEFPQSFSGDVKTCVPEFFPMSKTAKPVRK